MRATVTPSRYDLAASAEWQAFLNHFELGDGFAFLVLLVEDEQGAATCRNALARFLEAQGKKMMELPAYPPETLKNIARPLLFAEIEPHAGAVWVERVVPEGYTEYGIWREAWRQAVAHLNQYRNPLRRKWPMPVIFVGAPWLQEVLRENAPDLWSVRTLVAWVEAQKIAEVPGGRYTPQPENASYRPDPEMAMEQANHLRARGGSKLGIARLLYRGGLGFAAQYRWEEAQKAFSEALEIRRREEAPVEDVADAAYQLGNVQSWLRDYPAAGALYEEARRGYLQVGSVLGMANGIKSLGDLALYRSDHAEAVRRYEEAIRWFRDEGSVLGEANCLQRLGDVALQRSEYTAAGRRYTDALRLFRQVGDVFGEAQCIRGLGRIAESRFDYEEARRRFEEAVLLYRKVQCVWGQFDCLMHLGLTAGSDPTKARGHLQAAFHLFSRVEKPYLAFLNCTPEAPGGSQWAAREAWLKMDRPTFVSQRDDEFDIPEAPHESAAPPQKPGPGPKS